MSVRPETAAREAIKFSLRNTIIGSTHHPVSGSTHASVYAKATQKHLSVQTNSTARTAVTRTESPQACGLTFKNITGKTTSTQIANADLRHGLFNDALKNTHENTNQEVACLTNTIAKQKEDLATKTARLQQTEELLAQATVNITGERAHHNGRMLQMHKKLETLHAEKESMLKGVSESQKECKKFEEHAKQLAIKLFKSEKFNSDSRSNIHALTTERDRIASELASRMDHDKLHEHACEGSTDAVSLTHSPTEPDALCSHERIKSAAELMNTALEHELKTAEEEIKRLHANKLEMEQSSGALLKSFTDEHEALKQEKDELLQSINTITNTCKEKTDEIERLKSNIIQNDDTSLRKAVHGRLSATDCMSCYSPHNEDNVKEEEELDEDTTVSLSHDNIAEDKPQTAMCFRDPQCPYGSLPTSQAYCTSHKYNTDTQQAHTASKQQGLSKVSTSRLHCLFTQIEGRATSVPRASPPWAMSKKHMLYTLPTQCTNYETSIEAKTNRLRQAVSSDIFQAIVDQRRVYLSASGMQDNEIQEELESLF